MQKNKSNVEIYSKLYSLTRIPSAIKQALGIRPDYTRLVLQGKSFSRLGMHREAINTYKTAIKLYPDDAEAYFNLGNAYSKLEMFPKAVKAYKQAVSKRSKYTEALNSLCGVYGKMGRMKEAADIAKRIVKAMPHMSAAYQNLGYFYSMAGMHSEAADILQKGLKIAPGNLDLRYRLACVYLELHNKAAAIREYERLKDIAPHKAEKLYHLIYSNNKTSVKKRETDSTEITHVYFKS